MLQSSSIYIGPYPKEISTSLYIQENHVGCTIFDCESGITGFDLNIYTHTKTQIAFIAYRNIANQGTG